MPNKLPNQGKGSAQDIHFWHYKKDAQDYMPHGCRVTKSSGKWCAQRMVDGRFYCNDGRYRNANELVKAGVTYA